MTIHYGMPREAYEKLRGENFSLLKSFDKSAAAYLQAKGAPREDTDALRLGRAIHLATYEPAEYGDRVAVWDGDARKGKKWEAFCAANVGLELLTEDQNAKALAIAKAVRTHPVAGKYVAHGRSEFSMQWMHKEPDVGGIKGFEMVCKGRPDFVSDLECLVDLKSTRSANPEDFASSAWNFKYHVQAAFYGDGYASHGQKLPSVILAVENFEPYDCIVYRVTEDIEQLGRETYRNWLRRLHDCKEANHWPGMAEEELALTLPRWAVPQQEDDLSDLGLTFGGAA